MRDMLEFLFIVGLALVGCELAERILQSFLSFGRSSYTAASFFMGLPKVVLIIFLLFYVANNPPRFDPRWIGDRFFQVVSFIGALLGMFLYSSWLGLGSLGYIGSALIGVSVLNFLVLGSRV